jgi:hypothetical protein
MPSRATTLAAAAGIILTFLIAFEPLQNRASENVIDTTVAGSNNTTSIAVNNTTAFNATTELSTTVIELAPVAVFAVAAAFVVASLGGLR